MPIMDMITTDLSDSFLAKVSPTIPKTNAIAPKTINIVLINLYTKKNNISTSGTIANINEYTPKGFDFIVSPFS